MIITKTPYRISFLGGGTDFPEWYQNFSEGGKVLTSTIDKYCYITCRRLPPFFEHNIRAVYSKIEAVNSVSDITHSGIRECLKLVGIDRNVEIHHDGDLPARSGLGSSSSFTVGLLNALYKLAQFPVGRHALAELACFVERKKEGQVCGYQDQFAVAYGGINVLEFNVSDSTLVKPLNLNFNRIKELEENLLLVYTGLQRESSSLSSKLITKMKEKEPEFTNLKYLVDEGVNILLNKVVNIKEFGKILHESWKIKRSLSDGITTTEIDLFYDTCYNLGAVGGKVLGAGGGGFILLFADPASQKKIQSILPIRNYLHVPFQFEFTGSEIIYERDIRSF